jgi:hypothetical protein
MSEGKPEFISGTLIGIRDGGDGPVIVVDVMGQYTKLPLDCEVSVNWAMTHMNNRVSCLVKNGRVTRVD